LQATEQYRQLVASSYASALSLQEWQVNIDSISCAGNIVFNSTQAATVIDSRGASARRMLLQDDVSSTTWDVTTATAANSSGIDSTEPADVTERDQSQPAEPSAETAVEVVTVFTVQVPVSSAGNAHVTDAVLQHSSNILSGPLSTFFAAAEAPIGSAMRLAGNDSSSSNDVASVGAPGVDVDGTAVATGGLTFEAAAISLTGDAYAAALAAMVAPDPASAAAPAQDDMPEQSVPAAVADDTAAAAAAAAAEHQLPGIPDDSMSEQPVLVDQALDQQQRQQQQQVTMSSSHTDDPTQHTPADVPQQEQQIDTLDAAALPTDATLDMSSAPAVEVTADQMEQPALSGADADAARAAIVTKMIEAAAAAAAQSRADAIEAIRELA
jgi:hypothetical protein